MSHETISEDIAAYDVDFIDVSQEYTDNSLRRYLKEVGRTALLNAADEVELAKDIEAGVYAGHLLEEAAIRGEKLPVARRRELALMERTGKQANDHMLEANLRLVVSIAKRYNRPNNKMELLDLIQEGNTGLIHAVELFDYTKGFKFSTYATWWIRQAINRGMADQNRTIRLPAHMVEKVNKLDRIKRDLTVTLGREPTPEEMSEEAGIDPEKIRDFLSYKDPVSLDVPVGEDEDVYLGDFIENTDGPSPELLAEDNDFAEKMREAMIVAKLTPREREVIIARYGLDGGGSRTLNEIGAQSEPPVTRERIRQIDTKARRKMQKSTVFKNLLADLTDKQTDN